MSSSEESVNPNSFEPDSEYSDENQKKIKKPIKIPQQVSDSQNKYIQKNQVQTEMSKLTEDEHKPSRILRPRNNFVIPMEQDTESDENDQNNMNNGVETFYIFQPLIESIHSKKIQGGELYYQIKFHKKSFLHCKWMTEKQLLEQDPNLKAKLKRADNLLNQEISKGREIPTINFELCYLEVEKVLECSDTFCIIHPKKASEIQNKWSEPLVNIMNILIGYEENGELLGIHLLHFSDYFKNQEDSLPLIDFSIICNKLYLDTYENPEKFWQSLGEFFKIVENFTENRVDDLLLLCKKLKNLAFLLFDSWVSEVTKRNQVVSEFLSKKHSEEIITKIRMDFLKCSGFLGEGKDPRLATDILKKFVKEYKNIISITETQNQLNSVELLINEIKFYLDEIFKTKENGKNLIEQQQLFPNYQSEIIIDQAEIQQLLQIPEHHENIISENNTEFEIQESLQQYNSNLIQKQLETDQNLQKLAQISEYLLTIEEILKDAINEIYTLYQQASDPLCTHYFTPCPFLPPQLDKPLILPEILMNKIPKNPGKLYLIKWTALSYLHSTWEREEVLSGFELKLQAFKRFNKTLDRESRKTQTERLLKFNQLREIISNPKKLAKTAHNIISELKRRVFITKDPRTQIFKYNPNKPPIFKQHRLLRSYQLESLNWMIEAWSKKRNIILADEMGLGKTIQGVAFLNHLTTVEGVPGPFLVLAPLSTLQHWTRVFEDWTDLNTVLYYDSEGKEGRRLCRELEWYQSEVTLKGNITKINCISKLNVVVTSFEVFLQDFDLYFKDLPFQHILIDEAHRLKNRNAKILGVLKSMVCKRIFLLTGTPIQNNLAELFSLLNFIEPSVFDDPSKFEDKMGGLKSSEQVNRLKEALQPYLLRRMKEEVETSIPPLQETIIDIELTSIQKIVYKTLYEKNKGTLQKGAGLNYVSAMNNLEMQLRKCCNHPFLIPEIRDNLLKETVTHQDYIEKLITVSGKMIFLDKLVQKYQKCLDKKLLIFSQFTEVLRILEDYFSQQNITFEKIDGNTKSRERQLAIDRFNSSTPGFNVFLLSTKAGGLGINLTSANIVLIYDSDWNPQNDVQAIARAHRIGQTSEVKVYRLVSKKTYETEMFERASKKLGLDQAIFLSAKPNIGGQPSEEMTKLKAEEIEILLRKGVIGLLQESKEENAQFGQTFEEIIEKARVANYSFVGGSYSLSKTAFNSEIESKVQIDDPDFWKKVFLEKDSSAQKIAIKFKELKDARKFRSSETQKQFFLSLTCEITKYLDEGVKKGEFCADNEACFAGILSKISKDNEWAEGLRELAEQMMGDFRKKSRRFKKIDERTLNGLIRKNIKGEFKEKKKQIEEQEEDDENDQEFEEQDKEKEKDLKQKRKSTRSKNDQIYDFDYKEKLKENLICIYCGLEGAEESCQSFCKRNYHRKCFGGYLVSKKDERLVLGIYEQGGIHDFEDGFDGDAFIEGVCLHCREGIGECFECRKLGRFDEKKFENQQDEKMNNQKQNLIQCTQCERFVHISCAKIDSKMQYVCKAHICKNCEQQIKNCPYVCINCTNSYHRKCSSKKNQILGNRLINCQLHKKIFPKLKENGKQQIVLAKRQVIEKLETEESIIKLKKPSKENSNSKRLKIVEQPVLPPIDNNVKNILIGQNTQIISKDLKAYMKKPDKSYFSLNVDPETEYKRRGISNPQIFDYENFKEPWCRYCGARYSEKFYESVYGLETLCQFHNKQVKHKRISISKAGIGKKPLHPEKNVELVYLLKLDK